jgi:protein-disulfide isomerase-like protein with CxxC motif
MGAVQRAFYACNQDVTQTDVLAGLAEIDAGLERSSFVTEFLAAETRNETFRDFLRSQEAGVQGFPCLAVGTGSEPYALVANGFRPLDGLPEAIETWLSHTDDQKPRG